MNCELCNFPPITGNQYKTSSDELVCGTCYITIHGTRNDFYPRIDGEKEE